MAACISLINMKGGVGKTTLATQIAWYAARRMDKKVLLIDLDPQANASPVGHVATDLCRLLGWRRSHRGRHF